jgi:predicted DNA-binding transcriptional regulator YafY
VKSDRLLSILLLLQAHGRVSERELAERLEVSQRTIHRDLESLSASSVPVVALRGATGGWELAKGWRTQVPGLNQPELQALLMAQPRALAHPRMAAAAQSALDKLLAALPNPMRAEAAAMRERLHIDPQGWWENGEDLSMLPVVQDAVACDRKLSFDYMRADGQQGPRTVDPFGLVSKGMSWYLVARTPKGMRTFRMSRMRNVVALETRFKRPARFDLAKHWRRSTAELESLRTKYEVLLEVSASTGRRLTAWTAAKPIGSSVRLDSPQPGWTLMRAEFEHINQARFVVLGLGSNVRVIEPKELRDAVHEELRGMFALQPS